MPPQTYKGTTVSKQNVRKASSDYYLRSALKVNSVGKGDSRSRPSESASKRSDHSRNSKNQNGDDEVLVAASYAKSNQDEHLVD